jgi:hypothetical protein
VDIPSPFKLLYTVYFFKGNDPQTGRLFITVLPRSLFALPYPSAW